VVTLVGVIDLWFGEIDRRESLFPPANGYLGTPCFHLSQWATTSLMNGAAAAHRLIARDPGVSTTAAMHVGRGATMVVAGAADTSRHAHPRDRDLALRQPGVIAWMTA